MKFLGVPGVFDYAGLSRCSRYRACSCCLPRITRTSASGLHLFGAEYPPRLSSVYASLCTSRYPVQDSRPSGSLLLSRKALQERVRQRIQRLVLAAPRAKTIGEAEKVFLVDLVEDGNHGLLDKFVFYSRDREGTLPSICFLYVHSSRGQIALLTMTFTAMLITAMMFSKSEAKNERQKKHKSPREQIQHV
jgi:hypothetical protein